MTQTKEDLQNIKEKLLEHFEKNYSPEEANDFKEKINTMNDIQFVEFLKSQGLIQGEGKNENCIFCSILSNKIPSVKINENSQAIAILEINPVSEGHAIIIPKKHIEQTKDFPEEAKKLADIVSKDLTNTFHPQNIEFTMSNITGHEIMNLIPVHSNENINSERIPQTTEQLKVIKEKIEKSKIQTVTPQKPVPMHEEKQIPQLNEKDNWLPKRMIP